MSRKARFCLVAAALCTLLLMLTSLGTGWRWHTFVSQATPTLAVIAEDTGPAPTGGPDGDRAALSRETLPPAAASVLRLLADHDGVIRLLMPLATIFGVVILSGMFWLTRHMMTTVEAHRLAAEDQRQQVMLLRSILDATADGILVVDARDEVLFFNSRLAAMWAIPPVMRHRTGGGRAFLEHVENQVQSPETYRNRIAEISAGEEDVRDEILFKDGRVF